MGEDYGMAMEMVRGYLERHNLTNSYACLRAEVHEDSGTFDLAPIRGELESLCARWDSKILPWLMGNAAAQRRQVPNVFRDRDAGGRRAAKGPAGAGPSDADLSRDEPPKARWCVVCDTESDGEGHEAGLLSAVLFLLLLFLLLLLLLLFLLPLFLLLAVLRRLLCDLVVVLLQQRTILTRLRELSLLHVLADALVLVAGAARGRQSSRRTRRVEGCNYTD